MSYLIAETDTTANIFSDLRSTGSANVMSIIDRKDGQKCCVNHPSLNVNALVFYYSKAFRIEPKYESQLETGSFNYVFRNKKDELISISSVRDSAVKNISLCNIKPSEARATAYEAATNKKQFASYGHCQSSFKDMMF